MVKKCSNDLTEMEEKDMNPEIEKAVSKNDEEWQKRMLLLAMVMVIALLGID